MFKREDQHCWYCHREESQIFCSKCGKGFHSQCAREKEEACDNPQVGTIKKCKQCSRLDTSRTLHTRTRSRLGTSNQIDHREMSRLLGQVLSVVAETMQPPDVMRTQREEERFTNISKFINFSTVENKVKNHEYRFPEELLHDLRKIQHIMTIEFGEISEQIDQYIQQVELNSLNIDDCPNCARNDYFGINDRASLCPKLHRPVLFDRSGEINAPLDIRKNLEELPLLVPGKVIGINPKNNWKHVLLFGSVRRSCIEVPKNNVFHLRTEDLKRCSKLMNSMETGSARSHLEMAIQESEQYLENLQQLMGQNWQYTHKRLVVESNHCLHIRRQADREDSQK